MDGSPLLGPQAVSHQKLARQRTLLRPEYAHDKVIRDLAALHAQTSADTIAGNAGGAGRKAQASVKDRKSAVEEAWAQKASTVKWRSALPPAGTCLWTSAATLGKESASPHTLSPRPRSKSPARSKSPSHAREVGGKRQKRSAGGAACKVVGRQRGRRSARSRHRAGSRSRSWEDAPQDAVAACVDKLISNLDDIFEHRSTLPSGKLRQIAADMDSQANTVGVAGGQGEGEGEGDYIKWMGKTQLPPVLLQQVVQQKEHREQTSLTKAQQAPAAGAGKTRCLPSIPSSPAYASASRDSKAHPGFGKLGL